MIVRPRSITHQHLLSILNTELEACPERKKVRILDVGCGNGYLIYYLLSTFNTIYPTIDFEIFGFDVNDHGVQMEGYFKDTISLLSEHFPDTMWEKRLHLISRQDLWPYQNEYFDIIISNQVLEHVHDFDLFFSELYRTLCRGGISAHLFPLRHCLFEGHLKLPLVHKILNHDFMVSYIRSLSRIGLGKFKAHHKSTAISIEKYSEKHADYMNFFTNYLSVRELFKMVKKHSFRASFRYTGEFYSSKLRSLLNLKAKYKYNKHNRRSFVDWWAITLLKYVSSVTLILEKRETYTKK